MKNDLLHLGLCFVGAVILRAQPVAASAPVSAEHSAFAIPATDRGLPGAGPIRRADWFQATWEKRRAEFAKEREKDQGAVVFFGDSITQFWDGKIGANFPGMKVSNRGISGDTTRGLLIRVSEDVIAVHPKGVVILAGTNDIDDQAKTEQIAGNIRLILEALRQSNQNLPILLCEVFPSSPVKNRPPEKIKALNASYHALAHDYPNVSLVETWAIFADEAGNARHDEFPDYLHPNDLGYKKWAAALRPVFVATRLLPRS